MVFGPTDTTVAGVGVLTLLTDDLGALMVFTVTTLGPVPWPAATVRVTTVMVPELVVTTYKGAPLPWGELGGKMGVRPTRRPEPPVPTFMPVVLVGVMMVEVVEVAPPAVPVPPAPPTECVMILAPVLPSWRI